MHRTIALLFGILLAASSGPARAGGPAGSASLLKIPWNVTEHRLSNGMRALLLPDRRAPVIVFEVWYGAGSREELPGKTGLAHMVEHMMFRGTKKYGPKEFSNLVKRNGGRHNAFTSFDYTAYYEEIASDRIELVIKLEADRMVNLVLTKEQFEPERKVILEERRMRTDDRPTGVLFEQLRAAAFHAHTYGNPIIGWETDIRSYTLEDMRAFYKRYYRPSNAIAVIVGDFEIEEAIRLLDKHFGAIPAAPFAGRPDIREPSQQAERRIIVRRQAQLPYVAMAFHTPNFKDEDAPALSMLETILGGGETSRLYQRLVRKDALSLGAGADYTYISVDPALFYLYSQVAPGKKTEDVERVIQEEVDLIVRKGVSQEELTRALRSLEAQTVFSMDSHYFRASLLGRSTIASNWRLLEDFLPALARVKSEDIVRVAKKYFVPKNRTTAVLFPLKDKKGKRAARAAKKGKTAKSGGR